MCIRDRSIPRLYIALKLVYASVKVVILFTGDVCPGCKCPTGAPNLVDCLPHPFSLSGEGDPVVRCCGWKGLPGQI